MLQLGRRGYFVPYPFDFSAVILPDSVEDYNLIHLLSVICDCSSRTLEFAPHDLSHILQPSSTFLSLSCNCLFCSVSSTPTTSDSFIVRAVGVEPTILTTIGIRLLSSFSAYLPPVIYRCRFVACKDLLLFSGRKVLFYWRFRKTSIPNLFASGTFPHSCHKPTVHLHTRVLLA